MVTCPNCKKEFEDGTMFCNNCGTKLEPVVSPDSNQTVSNEVEQVQPVAATPVEKKKIPKKALIFGAIGVAVVAIIVLVVVLLLNGGEEDNKKPMYNYAMYLKDGEIFYSDLNKESKPWQLTTSLFEDEITDSSMLEKRSWYSGNMISDNGKYMVYTDKIGSSGTRGLYYRDIKNPKAEPVKIDSAAEGFVIDPSSSFILYVTGDNSLYQYTFANDTKDKIASDVEDLVSSEDYKRIIYVTKEDSVYFKEIGKDKEKIASDISDLVYTNKKATTIYYEKDGSLYKQDIGKDKVEVASDVYRVIRVYESGEIYYMKDASTEVPLMNFVTDDMKDADAAMEKPEYPDYPDYPSSPSRPYRYQFATDEEYQAAYEQYEKDYEEWQKTRERMEKEYDDAVDAYYEDQEKYNAKSNRDDLREDLAERTTKQNKYSIYYYDGKEATLVSETAEDYDIDYAKDAPVIIYVPLVQSEIAKVKISEINYYWELENKISEGQSATTEYSIAVKNKSTAVTAEKEPAGFTINKAGTTIYYLDNLSEDHNYGDLYRINIKNGAIGKAELYDSEVCTGTMYTGVMEFIDNDRFMYYKDVKASKGEVYINKEKIDFDVNISTIFAYADSDLIVYFVDWDSEDSKGTLKVYKNGKATKIADDASSFTVTPDGRVLYLYDYSAKYFKGELREWANGKSRKIDDDVMYIIPTIYFRINR